MKKEMLTVVATVVFSITALHPWGFLLGNSFKKL